MYGVRLLGIGRLMLPMAKMAWVDVGLDDAQPNLRAVLRVKRGFSTASTPELSRPAKRVRLE